MLVLKQALSMLRPDVPVGWCRRPFGPGGIRWQARAGLHVRLGRQSACTHSCGLSHTQQMHTNPLNVFRWETQFLEFPGAQPALADAPTTVDKANKSCSRSSESGRGNKPK